MAFSAHTSGIVLQRRPYGEADVLLSVFTPDRGKVRCMARGARRLKSRFCGRLEPLSFVELRLFEGRGLDTLDEAELILSRPAAFSPEAHGLLFCLLEVTERLLPEGQAAEDVFLLLSETLALFGRAPDPETVVLAYLVKLTTLLGFMAPWNQCSVSGRKLDLLERVFMDEGDFHLHQSALSGRVMPAPLVKWISHMQTAALLEATRVRASYGEKEALRGLLQRILENLMGRPFVSGRLLSLLTAAA